MSIDAANVVRAIVEQASAQSTTNKHSSDFIPEHHSSSVEFERIVIALSGGIDSMVLLHLCHAYQQQLQRPLAAAHIHHGLSQNAYVWQTFCRDFCVDRNIEFLTADIAVENNGQGLEAAARDGRYKSIAQLTNKTDLILLAQHADDQIETLFLQLTRGAGLAGLVSMPGELAEKFERFYFRPLLNYSRQDIERYASDNQLQWVEDESNSSNEFDRNFLRNEILPKLKTRFANLTETVARSVAHLQESHTLLRQTTKQKLLECISRDEHKPTDSLLLNIDKLLAEDINWQKQILKLWISENGIVQPSKAVLTHIINDCVNAKIDAEPLVQWSSIQCRRFDGNLYLVGIPETDLEQFAGTLSLEKPLELPGELGHLSLTESTDAKPGISIDNPILKVRFGGFSARFKPYGEPMSKPLSQWFKQWRVPPWDRKQTPLIFSGEKLIQVGDTPSNDFSLAENSESLNGFRIEWHKK